MKRIKITLSLIFMALIVGSYAQNSEGTKVKLNHYSFTIGAGWTHYIDNLDYGNDNLKNNYLGVSGKFFWEPEYRLSLGLETGYYKLFHATQEVTADTSVYFDRMVVPFLLLARMRIIDHFYLGVGMGIAVVTNKTEAFNHNVTTKMNSLSNFELSASYVHPLTQHWLIGGEAKCYHYAGLNDWMYSIQATLGFKL